MYVIIWVHSLLHCKSKCRAFKGPCGCFCLRNYYVDRIFSLNLDIKNKEID